MTKNILIVEDQVIVQIGLNILLEKSLPAIRTDFAPDFQSALKMAAKKEFDLIILDIHIPGTEKIRMLEKLRQIQPGVKIMIFTGLQEKIYASYYLQAGADAFISKINNEEHLIRSVKKLLAENRHAPGTHDHYPAQADPLSALSTREYQVMTLLIQGKITKEIALGLNLTSATISTHKSNIFEKLKVGNVIELITKVNMYKSLR